MEVGCPVKHWVKINENEKKEQELDLFLGTKKVVEYEGDSNNNCN